VNGSLLFNYLVQYSACPEKIAEFLSKKDEEKHTKQKRKPKPRMQSNTAPINEVDKQFQELLINIKEGKRNPLKDISNRSQQNYVKDILEPYFFFLCTASLLHLPVYPRFPSVRSLLVKVHIQ
jgi:hypothetical protein